VRGVAGAEGWREFVGGGVAGGAMRPPRGADLGRPAGVPEELAA
jgi:hypothetical protein